MKLKNLPSSSRVKLLMTFIIAFICSFTVSQATTPNTKYFNENEVKSRLSSMELMIKPQYTAEVKGYLNTYLIRIRQKSEKILGRTSIYFPIFEKHLKENDMPEDLKYLSVVESALNPDAKSWASAVGLWQFMPATGKEYGLQIDNTIDERKDCHKSTLAAIAYLKNQYDRYGNWELSLAAYNSGAGRVNAAIKRGRSTDFWRIQKYLPRETRSYVPAFIAAAYLVKHYKEHDLEPNYPHLDFQMLETITVFNKMSFKAISKLTGLPTDIIQQLNPQYKNGIIQPSTKGNNLVLPRRVASTVAGYLKYLTPDKVRTYAQDFQSITVESEQKSNDDLYFKSLYYVEPGDDLQSLASIFGCSAQSLMGWNDLQTIDLPVGKELVLYYPREILQFKADEKLLAELSFLMNIQENEFIEENPYAAEDNFPRDSVLTLDSEETTTVVTEKVTTTEKKVVEPAAKPEVKKPIAKPAASKYKYYTVKKGQTLGHIAEKLPGVSVSDLKRWNNIRDVRRIQPGQKLKYQ